MSRFEGYDDDRSLALHHQGLCRGDVALPQGNLRLGGRNGMDGFLVRGLCLGQLRFQGSDLHARERLALLHEIAFLDQYFFYAARQFGGDVHFGGFDAPVAAREPGAGPFVLQTAPSEPDGDGNDDEGDQDDREMRLIAVFCHGRTSWGSCRRVYLRARICMKATKCGLNAALFFEFQTPWRGRQLIEGYGMNKMLQNVIYSHYA